MSSTPISPPVSLPGPWEGVVFDMDGLLVHTERQWLAAKLELCRRHDHVLSEADKAAVFGLADLESATYFAHVFGLDGEHVEDLRQEYLDIVGELIDSGVELTDGAAELIDRLREAGGAPRFTVYPYGAHWIWQRTYARDDLYAWLLDQSLAKRRSACSARPHLAPTPGDAPQHEGVK